MSLIKDVEVLRSIPIFAKIEPAKLKLLAFTSERLQFMDGDEICHQGEVGDAAYIILDGEADVLVDTPGGALRVATVGKNDIIGEIAILCDVPRTATVTASTDVDDAEGLQGEFLPAAHAVSPDRRRGHARAGVAPAPHHPAADRRQGPAERAREEVRRRGQLTMARRFSAIACRVELLGGQKPSDDVPAAFGAALWLRSHAAQEGKAARGYSTVSGRGI